jgi:hypothetical protein
VKEGRPRTHFHKPIALVCHMTLHCEHTLYMTAFSHSCFILSAMDSKIEQHVYIKFCVKLCKSTTETLEMVCEAFGEHSLSETMILNGVHVSRLVE